MTKKLAIHIIAIACKLVGGFELKIDDYMGFVLNNASRKWSQLKTNLLKPYDITSEQGGIIRRLGEEEGISQKDLSKRMGKDQTNVTRMLDQLERKGLIRREANLEDRRSSLTYLTEKGKDMNQKLIPVELEIMEIGLKGLSEEKKVLLKEIINEIVENINIHNNDDIENSRK